MRIRIINAPSPHLLQEFDVPAFTSGSLYDVNRELASLLVVSGYAIVEMRARDYGVEKRRREPEGAERRQGVRKP